MKFKFILIQLLAWTMCTGAFAQTNIVAGGSVMDERGGSTHRCNSIGERKRQ